METTVTNASLADLAKLLTEQQAVKLDAVVPASAIRSVDGNLVIDGLGEPVPHPTLGITAGPATFRPTAVADEGLAEKLGIPLAYLRRLRASRTDLFDANVNGWLHGPEGGSPDGRSFLVRAFKGDNGDGIARALLSDSYRVLDNLDVLTAALSGIRESGAEVQITRCDLSERRMYVTVAAPGIATLAPVLLDGYRNPLEGNPHWGFAAAAREGQGYKPGSEPIVLAGFVLSNSEVGGGAMTLTPRLVVQICQNGLTISADALRAVHLGGKLDEGIIEWSADTQERQAALITAKARDAVKTFLSPDYLTAQVRAIEAKAGKAIENPAEAVRLVGKQLSFTEATIEGVLDHFIRGGQVTAGGVLQAVTSYAQLIPDADESYSVEAAALRALDLAAAL